MVLLAKIVLLSAAAMRSIHKHGLAETHCSQTHTNI